MSFSSFLRTFHFRLLLPCRCILTDAFTFHTGTVLELHGPEGTGKTEMLYHLTARCILPQSEGGLEAEVLFVDTDVHFDMLRLVTILEHRLSRGSEETIKQCLGRLFLVCCASSSQLLLTLYSLEAMFCSHPSLCLLILDSFSAFYWVDRANGGESVHLQESTLKKCSQVLEKLVNEYRLAVFATTQSLMRKTPSASEGPPPGPSHAAEAGADSRPYLCQAWQQLVKHRVFFSKDESQTSNRFSLVSRHLKSNRLKKLFFIIGESGVEFC